MIVSKIQQFFKLASSFQEIILQWIPSHTIPQNNIAEQACWYTETYTCLWSLKNLFLY